MHFDIAQSKRKFVAAACGRDGSIWPPRAPGAARGRSSEARPDRADQGSRGMSSHQRPLQRRLDPAIIAFAIAIYLDAVEQLAKALSASDAKAACLKLRE